MTATLKRYLWVVPALLTVLVAWFVASAAGELLLGSIGKRVDLSQAPPSNIEGDAGLAAGYGTTDKPIRLDDLLAGNLFDLPPEDLDAGAADAEPEVIDVGLEPPSAYRSTIPPCAIAVKVIAVIAGTERHPELGFATLEVEGKTQEYRIGYDVGGHRVSLITWNRVFLDQPAGAGECFIDIRYPDLARAGGTPGSPENKPPEGIQPPTPAPAPTAPAEGASREDRFRAAVDASIEVTSDTDRNVQRSLINTILDNQDIAMRQARVMPHEENGEVVGFKVYGIRRDSLFGKLGLENGDLIQTINGIPMTGADKALQAYGRLRMADRISISVTRRGQSMTLNYNIR